MDKQAFKQRMQNLKSYRENNPGKGYWDWKVTAYADGGEVKDDRTDHSIAKPIIPENIERIVNGKPWSQLSAQEQFMNRSGYSNGRPLERGLELVHPEFDILSSVRGVSSTVKGLMDTVIGRKLPTDYAYRRTTANELKDIVDSNSFRSIPDNVNLPTKTFTTASGKTVTFGKKKGNSHGVKAFSAGEPWKATTASGDKANEIIIGIPGDNAKWMTGFHGNYEGPFNFKDINKGTGIAVPFNEQGIADISTNIRTAEDYPKGLIRHEIGHYVDEKAYPGGVPNNAYLRQLGKPSKYRPFSEVEHMFPDKDRAKSVYEYLRKPTEKKSIMNQFDEYLMNTLTPGTYPTNTKQFRQVIESAPDLYNNMKMLLKIHTKPSVLYKDFLTRPLVNKVNKNKNQEIV